MARPKLLDLFCGAGGAGVGYDRAGFEVVGVDINPQPRYPFEFHQADALEYVKEHGHEFDVIAASPPCRDHTRLTSFRGVTGSGFLLDATRQSLRLSGKPYVIENVMGAPMVNATTLCGSQFGLGAICRDGLYRQLRRHRQFESNIAISASRRCSHQGEAVGVYGHGGGVGRGFMARKGEASSALGIDWMTQAGLAQAIPPAYTEHIGKQLLAQIVTVSA